ncbi:MAG: histidinol-phosphate transaminase [Deltaproteobacteria bacterium]|jgi:histidinol-phosphate aminotransferase|nr:histidinol-phosphate transaminase [Deltaproteobacteria bacterium]
MKKVNVDFFIPRHIKELGVYVPGRLIEDVLEELGLKSAVKLASNENSLGPSPLAIDAMSLALGGLGRYGDADSRRLREAISKLADHPPEGILAGNGSSEFILVMSHALLSPGATALMSKPSFTLYAKNSQASGAKVVESPLDAGYGHDLEAIASAIDPTVRLIFLDNPLNPTGAYLRPEAIYKFLEKLPPTTLLVLDEAYIDFCRAPRPDYKALLATNQVIIYRTFSKIFGLAGLRVGYALMAPELAEALNKVRQPFNLNSLTQVAVLTALKDEEHLKKTLSMTWSALDQFKERLPEFGLTVYPTQANFIMARLPQGIAADAFTQALMKEGVIIRSLTSFGLPNHVRINAGTQEELSALFAAMSKVCSGR